MTDNIDREIAEIHERYKKRNKIPAYLYSPLNPYVMMTLQERERILIKWASSFLGYDLSDKKLLEIGAGGGYNLIRFMALGFRPENLIANDLLPERIKNAKALLPSQLRVLGGNALDLEIDPGTLDVVFQSAVFSSILDKDFQARLAGKMVSWLKPEGGVLWYDFVYNNPANKDVRGIPLKRIRALFPEMKIKVWRLTLAPPISKAVVRIHPGFYNLFNLIPLLRTHVLCWITRG